MSHPQPDGRTPQARVLRRGVVREGVAKTARLAPRLNRATTPCVWPSRLASQGGRSESMRKPDSGDFLSTSLTTLVLVANLSVSTAWAQRPFANGDAGERGATRVLFWSLEGKQALGQMAMGYGRPEWTDQLAASFDEATRGRVWRCGTELLDDAGQWVPIQRREIHGRSGVLLHRRETVGGRR